MGLGSCYPWEAGSTTEAFHQADLVSAPHEPLYRRRWKRSVLPPETGPCSVLIVLRCLAGGSGGRGAVQSDLRGRSGSRERKGIECSVKQQYRLPARKALVVLTVFMQTQGSRPPSLEHLVVTRLPHPGHRVDEEPEKRKAGHPHTDPPRPWA